MTTLLAIGAANGVYIKEGVLAAALSKPQTGFARLIFQAHYSAASVTSVGYQTSQESAQVS